MKIKDLILESSGKDERGFPKSGIGLFYERWKEDGTAKSEKEVLTESPVVNIFQTEFYTQVDLVFSTTLDVDLRMAWDLLQGYAAPENSYDEDSDSIPAILLTIVPKKYEGKYHFLGTQPVMFTLQPENVAMQPTIIRIIFDNENFIAIDSTDK